MKIIIMKKVDLKKLPTKYIKEVDDGQITLDVPPTKMAEIMKVIRG